MTDGDMQPPPYKTKASSFCVRAPQNTQAPPDWKTNERKPLRNLLALSFRPRSVCDVSLSRVCGGKQKEVGSTGPAGACQLLGCLLLRKENRNQAQLWQKIWNLNSSAVPSSDLLCQDRDLDVFISQKSYFPFPSGNTRLLLMDPCSEIMWGSSGRRGKTTFFFLLPYSVKNEEAKWKRRRSWGDAVCLVTGQRPWFAQMTSSFYYPWYPAVVSAAAPFSLTHRQGRGGVLLHHHFYCVKARSGCYVRLSLVFHSQTQQMRVCWG